MGIRPDQVERLLSAAAIQVAKLNEQRHDRERPVASPRAARLRELEDDPPDWLSKVIGKCPHSIEILCWRHPGVAPCGARDRRLPPHHWLREPSRGDRVRAPRSPIQARLRSR